MTLSKYKSSVLKAIQTTEESPLSTYTPQVVKSVNPTFDANYDPSYDVAFDIPQVQPVKQEVRPMTFVSPTETDFTGGFTNPIKPIEQIQNIAPQPLKQPINDFTALPTQEITPQVAKPVETVQNQPFYQSGENYFKPRVNEVTGAIDTVDEATYLLERNLNTLGTLPNKIAQFLGTTGLKKDQTPTTNTEDQLAKLKALGINTDDLPDDYKKSLVETTNLPQTEKFWRDVITYEFVKDRALDIETQYDGKIDDFTKLAGDVSTGVLDMLPQTAMAYFSGGTSAMAYVFADSASRATKNAIQLGADVDQAKTYGLLMGAIETGTEMIAGGWAGVPAGKFTGLAKEGLLGTFENATLKLAKTELGQKVIKLAYQYLGEGAEEYLSEILGNYANAVIGQEVKGFGEVNEDALYAGLVGTLSAVVGDLQRVASVKVSQKFAQDNVKTVEEMPKEEQLSYVNELMSKTGTKVIVADTYNGQDISNSSGAYDPQTKTVIIPTKAYENENILTLSAVHEFTHTLETSGEYQGIQDSIIDFMKKNGTYAPAVADIVNRYGTKVDVNSEIVADFLQETMFKRVSKTADGFETSTDALVLNSFLKNTKGKNILQKAFGAFLNSHYAGELTTKYDDLMKQYKQAQKDGNIELVQQLEPQLAQVFGQLNLTDKAQYFKSLELAFNSAIDYVGEVAPKEDLQMSRDIAIDNVKLQEDITKAKELYGTTTNIKEAGYLLTDGTLLDFSEKNDGGTPNTRTLDHGDIENQLDITFNDFTNEGNIRVIPEIAGLQISAKPTNQQLDTIEKMINDVQTGKLKLGNETEFKIDLFDQNNNGIVKNGQDSKYLSFDFNTNANKIINAIKSFYNNDGLQFSKKQDAEIKIRKTPIPMAQETKTRSYQTTAVKSGVLNEEQISEVDKQLNEGKFDYIPSGDKQALKYAAGKIFAGADKAYNEFTSAYDSNKNMTKNDIAVAEGLIKYYADQKQNTKVNELIGMVAELGTSLGQQVQALSLIKKMSPAGQAMALQRTADKIEESFKGKKVNVKDTYSIPETANVKQVEVKQAIKEFSTEKDNIANWDEQGDLVAQVNKTQKALNNLAKKRGVDLEAVQLDQTVLDGLKAKKQLLQDMTTLQNKISKLAEKNNVDIDSESSINAQLETLNQNKAIVDEVNSLNNEVNRLMKKNEMATLDKAVDRIDELNFKKVVAEIEDAKIKIKKDATKKLNTVIKSLTKLNKTYEGKKLDLTIDPELKDALLNAKTPQEIEDAVENIKADLATRIPATLADQLYAWRMLSMLGNPTTHIRNLISNATFAGVSKVKDKVALGLETVFLSEDQKTKSLTIDQNIKNFSSEQFELIKDTLSASGKYDLTQDLESRKKVLPFKWLEKMKNWNGDALNYEDLLFMKNHFNSAFGQFMMARKYDPKTITDEQLQKALEYSMEQAKIRTFRQASALATKLSQWEKESATTRVLIGSVLPFKKTPINILKTGFEYSPAGLLKSMATFTQNVKSEKWTPAEAIDHISAGLTGSAIAGLGAYMFSQGILSVGDDDEKTKKEKTFGSNLGNQRYSLNIGDYSVSLDWLSPAVMPLMMGAEIMKATQQQGSGDVVNDMSAAFANIFNPAFDLTMLQGVADTFSSFETNGSDQIGNILSTIASNYATQFVPTVSSKIAKIVDPTLRTTYAGSEATGVLETTFNKIKNKIPFSSMTLEPVINVKGQEVNQIGGGYTDDVMGNVGGVVLRALQNLLNPATVRENITDATDEEILKVFNQTGDTSVIPSLSPSSFTYDGEKVEVAGKDKTQYAKTMGTVAYNSLNEVFSNELYKNLSSDQKSSVISKVLSYSSSIAKAELLGDKYINTTLQKMKTAEQFGVKIDEYLIMNSKLDTIKSTEDFTRKEQFIADLVYAGYSDEEIYRYLVYVGQYSYDKSDQKYIDILRSVE